MEDLTSKISPVFVSVLYRSGSTLLNLILNQSEELNITYDTIHFLRFSLNHYDPIENGYKKLIYDTQERIKEKWDQYLDAEKTIREVESYPTISKAIVYHELVRNFLSLEKEARWVDRSTVAWEAIPNFLNMFPKGKVIHIYRDPRAVLASYKKVTFHPEPMYLDSLFASLAMFNFISRKEIIENERVYLLKYEDLVENPHDIVESICEFLKISFKKEMLNVKAFKDRFGDDFNANSSFTGPREKIDKKTLTVWKSTLSPIEIYFSEMILKNQITNFGYHLTGLDLDKKEFEELYELLHQDFVKTRYLYWLKKGDGQQAFPNTPNAYQL